MTETTSVSPPVRWWMGRLLLGLLIAWGVFESVASLTGSGMGESGLLIAALVLALVLSAERFLFARPFRQGARAVGLGRPTGVGLGAAVIVCVVMLGCFPLFSWITGAPLRLRPGWWQFLPGLFFQAGIAEEVLFRGYLFGHLREGRSFWRAALWSMPPFLAVHLLLFTRMDPAIAVAAVVTSLAMAFPLSRLFDLGGKTIWGPALVHWVVQGAIKLVLAPERLQLPLSLVWMGAALVVPWLVFAFSGRSLRSDPASSVGQVAGTPA